VSNRKKPREPAGHGPAGHGPAGHAAGRDAATGQTVLQALAALQAMSESMAARKNGLTAACRAWWGEHDPSPAEVPAWPAGSVGDRFFSGLLLAEARKTPPLPAATVPDAHVIAADPAHWSVATWVLVRAVILDGVPLDDPLVSGLLDVLARFAVAEFEHGGAWAGGAWAGDPPAGGAGWPGDGRAATGPAGGEPGFAEQDGPVFLLGTCALVDAIWALTGEDSLSDVLDVLAPALDDALPGEGQVIADALVRAFAHHHQCEMPGDAQVLERLGDLGTGDPLADLVAARLVTPRDSVRVGLTVLSVLAELGRSGSPSVLDDHRVRSLS
jgi:hypothetical protein